MPRQLVLITIFFLSGITVTLSGQVKNARKEMSLFNYSKAIFLLQKAVKSENPQTKRQATLLMAECYRKQNDIANARVWYGKSLESKDTEPISIYYFAQALRSAGEYGEARNMFLKYNALIPKDPRGKVFADQCDSAIAWKGRNPLFEIKNVSAVNTPQSEFGVVFYHKGILFASDRILSRQEEKTYGWTGNNYLRLFYAEPTSTGDLNSSFSIPELFPGLKGQSVHNGPVSFNRDFTEIFINRTLNNDKGRKDNDRIRTHLLKIFTATTLDGKWSEYEPFFLNSNEYSVGHPALSPDGNTLYFVSDMANGYGGTDIYFCRREAGKWSDPVNLGKEINTFGNEMFPYIGSSGELYFASDGLAGFGGFDLFVSSRIEGKWKEPENLGQPVNSSYDDFSLSTTGTGKTGYFSSNRPGGSGSDDIYSFRKLPQTPPTPLMAISFVSGCVKDKSTGEPVEDATVFVLDEQKDEVIILKTDIKGCFSLPVDRNARYRVKATKTSYFPDCLSFRTDPLNMQNDLSIPRDLLIDKLEINKSFSLENIFYDFDKWNIRQDAEPSLNNLVRIMVENPVTIELGSHTDCRGSAEYNEILSQKRAEAAVAYIIHQGIDPGRITAKGYGKSRLINRCNCTAGTECTEAEHQVNRRTEFRITGLSFQKIDPSYAPDRYRGGDILKIGELPDQFFGNCKPE